MGGGVEADDGSRFPEDCDVIGIVTEGREANPALVSRSDAGALVRLHMETATKT